jgi:hypothetical protein
MGGLEWTVKFTAARPDRSVRAGRAHFETLWEDSEFQRYDPANPAHRRRWPRGAGRESGDD